MYTVIYENIICGTVRRMGYLLWSLCLSFYVFTFLYSVWRAASVPAMAESLLLDERFM